LSDLRESGAIEQDADLVLLLFREEYYEPDNEEVKGLAEIIVAKQRNGPVGKLNLTFLEECTHFENFTEREEELEPVLD
jgi:replicative DNA helicase